jgi:hypothetical protein
MRRILVLLLVATAVHADDFEKKYQLFRKYINRPSLRKRVEGLEILASSGDVRALKVLAKVYAKPPKAPRDQTKYLTVSIAWDRFGEPEHVAAWEEWRNKFGKPTDAWLWFRALDINTMHNGAKTAMSVANSKRNIFLRAAAVHAVGVYHEPLILPLIPKFLDKRPERGLDRALLVEACGRALVRQINEVGTDEFRNAALKLMKQFDLKETPARTRWVLARCFARIFKSNKIYLESSAPWRQMLQAEDARTVKIDPRYAPQKRPTFVGIEATGKRIVYVIDMSDSMLTPLTAREQKILRGPVSGTRKDKKKKKEKDKSPLLAEKDLDWKKIKNRFDAAREYLIISLRSLEPDMRDGEDGRVRRPEDVQPRMRHHLPALGRKPDLGRLGEHRLARQGRPGGRSRDGWRRRPERDHPQLPRTLRTQPAPLRRRAAHESLPPGGDPRHRYRRGEPQLPRSARRQRPRPRPHDRQEHGQAGRREEELASNWGALSFVGTVATCTG